MEITLLGLRRSSRVWAKAHVSGCLVGCLHSLLIPVGTSVHCSAMTESPSADSLTQLLGLKASDTPSFYEWLINLQSQRSTPFLLLGRQLPQQRTRGQSVG